MKLALLNTNDIKKKKKKSIVALNATLESIHLLPSNLSALEITIAPIDRYAEALIRIDIVLCMSAA